ncbi:MAG: hypothetical protein N2745_11265 [Syntrophorhabdaceae bacterium]|nr:hypothetical protein [Syntrophorhabdaceae bacterium]
MEVYCVKIGMLMEIDYCVAMNEGLPCQDFIRCWGKRMDVVAFLEERFSQEELKKAFCSRPKSRMERIIDTLNMTKKHG